MNALEVDDLIFFIHRFPSIQQEGGEPIDVDVDSIVVTLPLMFSVLVAILSQVRAFKLFLRCFVTNIDCYDSLISHSTQPKSQLHHSGDSTATRWNHSHSFLSPALTPSTPTVSCRLPDIRHECTRGSGVSSALDFDMVNRSVVIRCWRTSRSRAGR